MVKVSTTRGEAVSPEEFAAHRGAPEPIDPSTGQHKAYYVLSPEELAKGFVRPVRDTYRHIVCNTTTKMGRSIAETYARDPKFYGSTFCVKCRNHYPVSQFVWDDEKGEVLGS